MYRRPTSSSLFPSPTLFRCVRHVSALVVLFFFFNDTATTEIYTLSLHDAFPIYMRQQVFHSYLYQQQRYLFHRSEEHTSELQSPCNLVCRLLLEKKKINKRPMPPDETLGIHGVGATEPGHV